MNQISSILKGLLLTVFFLFCIGSRLIASGSVNHDQDSNKYRTVENEKTKGYIIVFENTRSDKTFELMYGGKTLMVDPGWIVAIEVPDDKSSPLKITGNSYSIHHKGKENKLHLILKHPNFIAFDKCPIIDKQARAQRSALVATFYGSIDYFLGKETLKENILITPDSYIELGPMKGNAESPYVRY